MFVSLCRRGDGSEDPPLFRFHSSPKLATKYECPARRSSSDKKSTREFCNIMSDPRVRRGTYAIDLGPKIDGVDGKAVYPCFEMVKKDPLCQLYLRGLKKCSAGAGTTKVPAKITTKETKSQKKKNKAKMRAPSLLLGKISSQSQTDPYYEVLYEDMEQTVNCTQTELVTDLDFEFLGCAMIRNPKSGDDKETQILPGDLFDFTLHVAPIVISVSSVVVEQALLELMMESELETLLAQQRVYESRRNLELVRLQRLQRRQQDIVNENVRQIQAEKESMEEARKAGEAVSMALFAKHFLNDILSAAMDDARRDGVLTSEAEMGKDADPIMKWITTETGKSQTKNIISRNVLDDIIGFALVKRVPSPTMSMELSALDE